MREALATWYDLSIVDVPTSVAIDSVSFVKGCLIIRPELAGTCLIGNGDFTQGLDSWKRHPGQGEVEVVQDSTGPLWHVNYPGHNWGVLNQQNHTCWNER